MLDRKKVGFSDNRVVRDEKDSVKTGVSSTAATSKTDKLSGVSTPQQSNVNGLKSLLRAKRQIGGSSMMNLVKTGENQGQGAATQVKRPLMFGGAKKAKV